MKAEGHLGRCYLKGRAGDAANVILSAVGYNLRLVLATPGLRNSALQTGFLTGDYLDQQAIDTTTPMGKLVFQVTGAFAEFERTMIRQRIKAGLKRAVAQGVKLGRPKIDSATERKVRKQLAKGVGILKVAKSLGLGTGTVQRISNELG
jgi:Resolvase, N terminal domain